MTEAQSKRWGEIIQMDDREFVDEEWMLDALPPPRFCGSMTLRTYRGHERRVAKSKLKVILARRALELTSKTVEQATQEGKGFSRAVEMLKGPRGTRGKKIRWAK